MSYRVVITANAKTNLRSYYLRAARSAPMTAARWLDRFEEALQTLSDNPRRCPLAPEDDLVDVEVRQLLFGRGRNVYWALFTISRDEVEILPCASGRTGHRGARGPGGLTRGRLALGVYVALPRSTLFRGPTR